MPRQRRRVHRSRRAVQVTLNLASMIDVTFLLLIYFMVTTVIAIPEDRLTPALRTESKDTSGATSDFQPQIINVQVIDGAPAYRLGSRVLRSRGELAQVVRELPTDPGMFIRVYDGVPVGFAVAALQVSRDAGFEQVTYVPTEGS